jgi:uncharacterized Fe-S cluster-containing radical SAM superfamily protein
MKLREQEIRNVMWVSECVAQVSQGCCIHCATCSVVESQQLCPSAGEVLQPSAGQ